MIVLDDFINTYVIKRNKSMFAEDVKDHEIELAESINEKSILVIGGAGSIGSEFIRTILRFDPKELIVVDTNENSLTELTRSLRSSSKLSSHIPGEYITYTMDYSSDSFAHMFYDHGKFDIVANFSAHKHVRSEKDVYSIEAMIRNNIINAKGLLDILVMYPPNLFFCVSTDKAANPVSVMGASKRIMEDLIFSYSTAFPVKTARFANVAFSNGSLPAGFLERIRLRQPLSGPCDVKRYFVSPEESGEICAMAAILGKNREIMFPKLKEAQMVSFDKIAEDLLSSLGYGIDWCKSDTEALKKSNTWKEGTPYPVCFTTSDTSGEKQFEEFYTADERVDMERFKSVGVVVEKAIPNNADILELIDKLFCLFNSKDRSKEAVVRMFKDYLNNFDHFETGKSLDGKM